MTNDYHKPIDRDLFGNKTAKKKHKKREGVQSFEFFKQLRRRTSPNENSEEIWNEYLKYLRDKDCISPKLITTIKD